MSNRRLVLVSLVGTACFIACSAVAISYYPGGTWFNRRAPGHSFAYNFLCDLMQVRALNGVENPIGSLVAQIGMVTMLAALAAFFVQIARYGSKEARAPKITRRAGVFACALGCTVPIVRADWFHEAHLVVVVGSFLPALVATIAGMSVCLRSPGVSFWVKSLAILTLGLGAIDFTLYILGYGMAWDIVPSFQVRLLNYSLPVIQRAATLALLAWVLAVCFHTLSREKRQG